MLSVETLRWGNENPALAATDDDASGEQGRLGPAGFRRGAAWHAHLHPKRQKNPMVMAMGHAM
jgi:hypothetical protein